MESVELYISQQENCSLEREVYLTIYQNWGTGGNISCETDNEDVSKKDNVTWNGRSLRNCKDPKNPFYFDVSKDKIKFNFNLDNSGTKKSLDNLTDPSCPKILLKVLTIKFRNGTGSIFYSNRNEMNNWLNPKKGEDYHTAKKQKGK